MKVIKIVFIVFAFLCLDLKIFASLESPEDTYGDYLLASVEKNISMDLEGADLVDVLKVLSQQTGINFVSSEAVKNRKITLYLDKVPLKDAMDTIFKANNLSYVFNPDSSIFIIKEMGRPSLELQTEVYHLKNARVSSSRLTKEFGDGIKREDAKITPGLSSGGGGGDTKADIGILESVKKVLSEQGKVTEDDRTNSIIVTDVPAQFPLIEKVIRELDKPVPQVMIEVEMLDVKKSLTDHLGVQWGGGDGLTLAYLGPAFQTGFPFKGIIGGADGNTNNGATIGTQDGFTPGMFGFTGSAAAINFLKKDISTKALARPRIYTLSNHPAQIQIATDEAIGVTKNIDEDGKVTYEIERAKTGTVLRVTPQVNSANGEITLFLEPKVVEAVESDIAFAENLVSGKVMNPEERSVKDIVKIKDGHTLLVGGLIRTTNSQGKYKVPFLGDLPFLGAAFRYKEKGKEERELLIFLTPHIIKDDNETVLSRDSEERSAREQTVLSERHQGVDRMFTTMGRY